jgi:hypothetical protein
MVLGFEILSDLKKERKKESVNWSFFIRYKNACLTQVICGGGGGSWRSC